MYGHRRTVTDAVSASAVHQHKINTIIIIIIIIITDRRIFDPIIRILPDFYYPAKFGFHILRRIEYFRFPPSVRQQKSWTLL